METERFLDAIKPGDVSADAFSPLNLAYIGDAVFSLLVRSEVVARGNMSVGRHNEQVKAVVRAGAQAAMYHNLLPIVAEDELAVMKRGRNAKSFSRAKNASMSDYRHATGVEALFGYLFIKGKNERILELFHAGHEPADESVGTGGENEVSI